MLQTTIDAAERQHVDVAAPGDVVTLRTGGPRMTVMLAEPVGFDSGHRLICQWFDEHGELRQDAFAHEMVQIEPRSITPGSVRVRHAASPEVTGRA